MQKKKTEYLVKSALIAGVYAVLTLSLGAISFGNLGIEFRISEALTILPVFTPLAVPGLFVGCIISNLIGMAFSTLGIIDVIFGSLATLLAAVVSRLCRNITINGFPIISFISPIIFNAVIIGLELGIILPDIFTSISYAALIVGIGEAISVFGLGIPLYYSINKIPFLKKHLSD